MKKRTLLLASIVALLSLDARGAIGAGSSVAASQDDRLAPLVWLVGTWTGQAKAPDGSLSTVELTYQWADHKRAMKYTVARRVGENLVTILEGTCAWHPGRKQLVLWEVDHEGNVTESIVVAHGSRVSYQEMIYAASGLTEAVRAEAVRDGDRRFVFRASVPRAGEWPVVFEATYTRTR